MHEQQQHEMVLEKTYPAGAEEWHCPTCGRRFLFGGPPTYDMIVIEPGDQQARHSGSTGGLHIGLPQVDGVTPQAEPEALSREEEKRLASWLAWLDGVDFDNL